MNDDILVSICCITYNHEKYIKEALDGFLMQETNFKYEIIVHDDASTDATQDIIRKYEEKYPDIIKPIYQKENQYSKGVKASLITYKKAKGKYIAICEGDDFWIDKNKLQLQVDYMEKHPECSLCFHNAYIFNMENSNKKKWIKHNRKFYKKTKDYNAGELDLLGFIPTASYLFKREYIQNIPEWYQKCVVGDRTIKLLITNFGYAHYIDKIMSVYRIGTGQSMMDKINKENQKTEKALQYWEKVKWIVDKFNEFSNYKYNNELKISKQEIEKNCLMVKKEYKKILKEKEYRQFLYAIEKVKLYLIIYFPGLYEAIKKQRK